MTDNLFCGQMDLDGEVTKAMRIRIEAEADEPMKLEGKLLNMLTYGEENAVSMNYLARMLDVSPRDIREAVLNIRIRGGIIIASSDKGYYFPSNVEEAMGWFMRANARYNTTGRSLRFTRDFLESHGVVLSDEGEEKRWLS